MHLPIVEEDVTNVWVLYQFTILQPVVFGCLAHQENVVEEVVGTGIETGVALLIKGTTLRELIEGSEVAKMPIFDGKEERNLTFTGFWTQNNSLHFVDLKFIFLM